MKSYMEIMRGLREDNDLKQIEIANVLGTTQQHYSKYETGEYELPLRALIALADYYNVSADFLTGRTECKEGIDGLNTKVTAEHTAGEIVSSILSLSAASRAAVIDYINLQMMRESCERKKEKDSGRR